MVMAGQFVSAADYPMSVEAYTGDNVTNVANTNYQPSSPDFGVSFTAATSGQALVGVSASIHGDGTNLAFVAVEIREDNAAGAVVVDADDEKGIATASVTVDIFGSQFLVSGLEAGRIYYAHAMQRVNGGSGADMFYRRITIVPAP